MIKDEGAALTAIDQSHIINVNVDELKKTWMVYNVIIDTQKVYIGLCRYNQLLQMPDAYRNSAFREIIKKNKNITITLNGSFNDHATAEEFLKIQLAQCNCYANINGIDDISKKSVIICNEDGLRFSSISEAARYYDIDRTMLSKHISNDVKYKHIRKRTFKKKD